MTETHRYPPPRGTATSTAGSGPLVIGANTVPASRSRTLNDLQARRAGLTVRGEGRVGPRAREYNSAVDPLTARAAEEYHRLLRDEKGLVDELEERFFERIRQARLMFGGRVLCAFPRPNFVSPAAYEAIRGVCRQIFRAVEKVEARLGEELWDRVDLTAEERELVRLDPGYRRSSPTSRLDSFITTDAYRFVELNAESPAGIAYNEVLVEIFLELPVMK